MKKRVIGITDCSSYSNYEQWILNDGEVETIRLGYTENNLDDVSKCDGIVLSGGQDVHPRFYNRMDYLEYCDVIDERRDEFEWNVIERAEAKGIALLGICRGLQIANVYFGGTLIPDIPTFGKYNHSKFPDADRRHTIHVDPQTELATITGKVSGTVNSAHHQSADRIGRGLVVNSFSPDGVVEGIERIKSGDKPYLMLVQWHPERMKDLKNPFSLDLRNSFIIAVRNQLKVV